MSDMRRINQLFHKQSSARRLVQDGFSLLEIVIAASVLTVVMLGAIGTLTLAIKMSLSNTAKVQAVFLEEEGIEAVRILRDNGWTTNIASQVSPFYLVFDGTTWQATTANVYVDGMFERRVTIESIYRDAQQKIVWSGGTLDSNAKKVTVAVSWLSGNATTTKSISTILTNIFNN